MRILDLDMDYFMDDIANHVPESSKERLSEEYNGSVWNEERVRSFIEHNLGLSKSKKIKGRIVAGHNESLFFWRELIASKKLTIPFEVVHVDSHADLGLGYDSWSYIMKTLLSYPVEDRPKHCKYKSCFGKIAGEGIGDYLLFAIAYQWISHITYCANPSGDKNDYVLSTLKNFEEEYIFDELVENTIQLLYNPDMKCPEYGDSDFVKKQFIKHSRQEPEVPLLIIPTIDGVKFDGDYDYAVMAQSPNYTPARADFIIEIFREYITEC